MTTRKRAPGGGRHPLPGGGTVRKGITILADDLAHLNTIDASTTKAVRELVKWHKELPLEAIEKLAYIVLEEWNESYSADVVYEWLDKRKE
jgi:hypothetical protein